MADAAGLARFLLARRGRRRGARVRGSRRRVRELRRLASDPLALRDLATAGAMLDPLLALSLVSLAVDPSATYGDRFTIAHAPLAGGPADAWLRVQNGAPRPSCAPARAEPSRLTIRSTRGALLPLLAGVEPPRGEAAVIDGDADVLPTLRGWIARTEFPAACAAASGHAGGRAPGGGPAQTRGKCENRPDRRGESSGRAPILDGP